MKRTLPLCLALWAGFAAGASADPIVFNTAQLTTSGVFNCFNIAACSASGNTATLGAGGSAVMLTFTGVTTSLPVSNQALPVSLGTISASSSSTTFPQGINPRLPIVELNLLLAHTLPVPDSATVRLGFGQGGGSNLRFMQGGSYLALDPGPVPPGYGPLVYTLSRGGLSIPINGSVDITAAAGVVPEPGTVLLVGSGLLLGYRVKRQRRQGGLV